MSRSACLALAFLLVLPFGRLTAAESAEVSSLRAKAERGNALAQYNLGLLYAQGQLVPADLPEAFVWLSLASENGSTGKALDSVLGNINDGQLAEGRRRLADYRTALASRTATPTLGHANTRKPVNRGFSLTAPVLMPSAGPAATANVTKAPEPAHPLNSTQPIGPAPGELILASNDPVQLKAELARALDRIQEQDVTIAKLRDELAHKFPGLTMTASGDPVRTSPPDGPLPAAPSR